jgi:hypothetical protein
VQKNIQEVINKRQIYIEEGTKTKAIIRNKEEYFFTCRRHTGEDHERFERYNRRVCGRILRSHAVLFAAVL